MSLTSWAPAGRGRAGPPRGSGQPASHEPGCAATAPEQTPFVCERAVGASGTQAPEPALPASPRRDPRLGRGRAGCAGGSAAPSNGTGTGGLRQPTGSPGIRGRLWDGGGSDRCPLPASVPPGRPRRSGRRDASPDQPHGGTPGQGWGSRWGRLGRNVPGQAGKERQPRAQPQSSALALAWGPVRAARGSRSPQPHIGCNECSELSPHWVQ